MAKSTDNESAVFIKLMTASKVTPLKKSPLKSQKTPHYGKLEPIEFIKTDAVSPLDSAIDISEKFKGGKSPRKKAVSQKIRLNRQFEPDSTLDLHGKTQIEAIDLVENSINSARNGQIRTVLIITGKGTHSGKKGSVIKNMTQDWLESHQRSHKFRFQTAPARLGGNGAFLVFIIN